MSETNLLKPALFALGLVAVALCGWEMYLRTHGVDITYDDGPPLWAHKRAMVYEPTDKTVVFIGSSRIKYDLDIPTWESITGTHAVQLAMEGSSPRPVLEDLANDTNFKGRLVVDVTEGLFFSNSPNNAKTPNENIAYFHDHTPAQQSSFYLNRALESQFAFLDKDNLSLNARLDALEIPSRPGVFMMPIFPMDFQRVSFGRQMFMTDRFVADTIQRNKVKGIWAFFGQMARKAPPMSEADLDAIFQSVKTAIDKIKARGGEVLLVRTPSSGGSWAGENMGFPREKYWNHLLEVTGCPGIHFADYPAIDHFVCPEDSHLSKSDAV
ncbi:MAG: hypothetical protein ACOYNO_14370 [Saprospiraceae bacterium]